MALEAISEQIQKYTTAPSCEAMSPEEQSKARVKSYNETEGSLHLEDGHECAKCRNKGKVLKAVYNEQFNYWAEVAEPCECSRVRNAIRRLDRSGLKNAVHKCTFDSYETTEPWQKTLKALVKDFADKPDGGWLFVGGAIGSGKTHLCTAAAVKFLKRGSDVRYMLWREDAPKIKSAVNDSEEYVRLVEPLKTVDLLYIDDLFKTGRSDAGERQRPTVADINLAFEIINHRYTAGLTTIISSECTDAELIDIDQAVAGRIIERSKKHCISLKGKEKDYRLKGNLTL